MLTEKLRKTTGSMNHFSYFLSRSIKIWKNREEEEQSLRILFWELCFASIVLFC